MGLTLEEEGKNCEFCVTVYRPKLLAYIDIICMACGIDTLRQRLKTYNFFLNTSVYSTFFSVVFFSNCCAVNVSFTYLLTSLIKVMAAS